ncbi:MAG: dihydroorotase [Spirochaetota bacterium]
MLLIKNGIVTDPANGIENEKLDILIDGAVITKVQKAITASGAEVIDASGKHVFPGLIDMHVHLREPGEEHKETIASGSKAAAAGGFTTIACMANTKPATDTASQIKFVVVTAEKEAAVNVLPYGAVTKDLAGQSLTEFGDMLSAGAIGFSDDGHTIMNANVMRRALEYLRMFDKPIIVHAEDDNLCGNGTVHESAFGQKKGLKGIPKEAEEIIIARDIHLAKLTGGRVHFTHISSDGSIALVREAKAKGLRVSADVTPHHLSLSTEMIADYDTNMKMRPPLRCDEDRAALRAAVLDGTVDAIATDHAPHSEFEKSLEFGIAPNGAIGLETAVPVVLEHIVEYKRERMPLLARVLSANPARILGIDRGTLSVGRTADVTIIDTGREYTYTKEQIVSRSKNSPFIGKKLKGLAVYTIVGGKIVHKA